MSQEASKMDVTKVIKDVLDALEVFKERVDSETDPDKKNMYDTMVCSSLCVYFKAEVTLRLGVVMTIT